MQRIAFFARWAARFISSVIILLIVLFIIGEGLPKLSQLSGTEIQMFVALFLMIAGAVLAWKSELAGGVVILLGFAYFWILGGKSPGLYLSCLPLSGCLYLISWLLRHKPGEAKA